MNRQKSFEEEKNGLWLVPVPIGNMQEVSPRVMETLQKADVIACEDTRSTGKLLQLLGIHKPLLSHHEHNWKASIPGILDLLEQGKNVAVVSDAGYPLLSDPGAQLVKEAADAGWPVVSMAGPNAAVIALVCSGLDTDHYLFYGFLDSRSSRRKKEIESLDNFPFTMIFYEAPHRIQQTLQDLAQCWPDRKACLARELTKLHEEFLRGTIVELAEAVDGLKGEMVLVVEGAPKREADLEAALERVRELSATMKLKEAASLVSKETGLKKNALYQAALKKIVN